MFNIVAMPRSRTYWLSRFLSTDTQEFLHEGIGNTDLEVIGNSTTMPFNINTLPDRTIIIERDFGEVIDSLARLFPMPPGIEEELACYQQIMDGIQAYRIHFNEINDNLDWIWELVHGTDVDWNRAEVLIQTNLQNDYLINQYKSMMAIN